MKFKVFERLKKKRRRLAVVRRMKWQEGKLFIISSNIRFSEEIINKMIEVILNLKTKETYPFQGRSCVQEITKIAGLKTRYCSKVKSNRKRNIWKIKLIDYSK